MATGLGSRTILILDEGSEVPTSLVVSDGLAWALARAAVVNREKDRFALSFTSLFVGLLAGEDPFGAWLRDYLRAMRILADSPTGTVASWADECGRAINGDLANGGVAWYDDGAAPMWSRLDQQLEHARLQARWSAVSMRTLAGWAARVARFTFTPEDDPLLSPRASGHRGA